MLEFHQKKKFFFFNKEEILIEFNNFPSSHPFLSLISNFLSKKFNCKIKAYNNYILTTQNFEHSILKRIKWIIGVIFNLKTWRLYKSFGVVGFVNPSKPRIKSETQKLINKITISLKKKSDIFNIKYKKIIIGDLIYDGYLKFYSLNTVELKDARFKKYIYDFMLLAQYWDDYFENKKVKFIIGCHPYYSYGLILRIGLKHKINCYYIISGKLYRMTLNRMFGGLQYLDYKKNFNHLTYKQKKIALIKSKSALEARFSGQLGNVIKDILAPRSAYNVNYNKTNRVLKKNKKIKILICTHQLGDCYYAYGNNLFPDFYEWLAFLANLSKDTEYDWYIKDHPPYDKLKIISSFNRTYALSKDIVRNNNKITYINPITSHNQLINEGIDYVLTIYGSVAFEYAYHNVPVLTATKHCPTRIYGFNIHSDSIAHYEFQIRNLKKIKTKIRKKEVLEFFFSHQFFNDTDCLFEDFSSFINSNTFDDYDTEKFYNFWNKKINNNKIIEMQKILRRFIDSKDYTLNLNHNTERLNKILLNN
jgi:hypothetical protein